MQHVLRCWERQSDGTEYKKTLRRPGLRPGPAEGTYSAPANALVGGEGLAVPSPRTHPHSRPFAPRLFYPTPKLVPTPMLILYYCVCACRRSKISETLGPRRLGIGRGWPCPPRNTLLPHIIGHIYYTNLGRSGSNQLCVSKAAKNFGDAGTCPLRMGRCYYAPIPILLPYRTWSY